MNQAEATEKPAPPKSKATRMLSFLSKNVKSVSFQNHPFSPGRGCHHHGHGKTFSGPIMIPAKSKSGRRFDADQEPTSPKISCMGQIKHKKKSKTVVVPRPPTTTTTTTATVQDKTKKKKPKAKSTTAFKPARNSDVKSEGGDDDGDRDSAPPPGLGQMKKFASSRDSKLAEFEWKDYSSDEDEVMVPHSAPMLIGGGKLGLEARNEVNLWKRRTMDPPKPLQLNKMRVK